MNPVRSKKSGISGDFSKRTSNGVKGGIFEAEYKKLNKAQKEAVETTEGPVMVIAGPGTGKTQVLALRIGNILKQTDTPADGVLCLTFTNSGVDAMKRRLRAYGLDASRVVVSTFHAFGSKLIEEFFTHLDLPEPPVTMDEADAVGLIDDILASEEWTHLRPRGDATRYYRDLKSLVSVLIRERLSPEDFEKEIDADIARIKKDPESFSSRGARKGELKREAENKIAALERSREVAKFYELYEAGKRKRNLFDYDDILRALVRLVTEFEDVRATLRERHLYVLVDEHQDSSGVQNEFLNAVWGPVERPNVFVVGDDRQLIYGFSGASLTLFEEFRENFPGTKLITLTENYRSTQTILNAADAFLKSTLAEGKLSANRAGEHPILLSECAYPRDEVRRAGLFFKERIAEGVLPEECALLVPKNAHVRAAAAILEEMGLQVSSPGSLTLFRAEEYAYLSHILHALDNPYASVHIAEALLNPLSGVAPLEAHRLLHKTPARSLSIETVRDAGLPFGEKLQTLFESAHGRSAYEVIQEAGEASLLNDASTHEELTRRAEVVRSLLHIALALGEKRAGKPALTLKDVLAYLTRLEEYGEDVPLALWGEEKGIRVMTLHRSKGLEFDAVWIAHMNERALMGGKARGLALPEKLQQLGVKKDEAAARREVYVALTRAKHYAALSYAALSHTGGEEEVARVLEEMPEGHFLFEERAVSEKKLLAEGPQAAVAGKRLSKHTLSRADLRTLVAKEFSKKKVSTTTLNAFYDCAWKWYFAHFLGLPEPISETLTFGSVVHGAIENVLKLGATPKEKELKAALEEALNYHQVYDEKARRRMTTEALRALKHFAAEMLPNLYDERESERPLSAKDKRFPELTMVGKIDLMEHDGGGSVRVTDFKTGKPRTAKEIEKRDDEERLSGYLRQLAMYSYLLETAGKGKYEVEKSRLYFVESSDAASALYETVIGAEEIALLVKDIADYESLLLSGEWTERPCNHKAYPGAMECPYCKRAEMYQ